MTDTTLAFVDFLRDNPDAMRQIENAEVGIKLLNALAQRSPISSLIPMTQNSLIGDKLLLHLNSLAAQKPGRKGFDRAIIAFSEEFVLESFWEIETVAQVLAEADLVDLIEHCPQLLDINHPLHRKLYTNPYWERRIHRYLVRGDFRRTWDEIGKARRGFPEHKQESADSIDRRFCRKQEVGEVVFRGEEAVLSTYWLKPKSGIRSFVRTTTATHLSPSKYALWRNGFSREVRRMKLGVLR